MATGVTVSPDQKLFVTGTTTGSLTGQAISNPPDVFVVKYSGPFGGWFWSKQLGVVEAEIPSIAADVNANTYVTGTTSGDFDGLPKTGAKDTFVIKLDKNGNKQWTGLLGVAGAETRGYGIAVDESGVSYVTGATAGSLEGQSLTGSVDAFVTKYDSLGAKQWTRLFGQTGLNSEGRGIGVDASGNAYVAGNSHDPSTNKSAFVILKYNSIGEKQWSKLVGEQAWGNAIAVDASGNCYATGTTQTSFDGLILSSGSTGASFITKYNSAGEKQWTKLLGNFNEGGGVTGWYYVSGNTIAIDESGDIHVTGWMTKNSDNMVTVAFTQKFNSAGEKQWTRRLGSLPVGSTPTYAIGTGVAVDRYPNVFVAGYLEGGGSFGGKSAIGVTDAFITAKFNCASSQYFDATSNTCVSIPACDNGMTFNQDNVACECPAGTQNVNGTCVPNCNANQYWDGSVCQPIPVCAAGTKYDPSTHLCVQEVVPAGSFASSVDFLYTGSNPIQKDVTPGAIDPKRVVVLRGKVLNKNNEPMVAVTVSILNHPEYGSTKTRSDGMFDLAVSGGGTFVVRYQAPSHLEAQRTITTPWQEFVRLPDVVLVRLDNVVTAVDLTQPVMQVAQGSAQTDADGTRKAVMLFPAGTTAQMVMPDGSTQPISTLHVRATEYTVGPNGPESMPAPLPPESAYTYAVELSVDEAIAAGAKSVTFSQLLPIYIDNFIHFPVGGRVPIGYYDREAGRWVAIPDGRVVKVIGITPGTPALAELDTDGDAVADNNPALGITDTERARVAELYQAGKELWRVQVQHFSTIDCNWPYGCPSDPTNEGGEATMCKSPKQPDPHGGDDSPDCNDETTGSIIECENQVLGQRISIVGTPFTLNYRSRRVPGYAASRMVSIPVSGDKVPSYLNKIFLTIDIAGQHIEKKFDPTPNQKYDYIWDGLDSFGRRVYGSQTVKIRIGYAYVAVYGASMPAGDLSGGASFGMAMSYNPGGGGGSVW